jgi:hypothetical protein
MTIIYINNTPLNIAENNSENYVTLKTTDKTTHKNTKLILTTAATKVWDR